MEERINELLTLIDTQLAMDVSDPVTESYKARNLASYTQTLKNLLDIKNLRREENEGL